MGQNPKNAYTIWAIEYAKEYARRIDAGDTDAVAEAAAIVHSDAYVLALDRAKMIDPHS